MVWYMLWSGDILAIVWPIDSIDSTHGRAGGPGLIWSCITELVIAMTGPLEMVIAMTGPFLRRGAW